MSMNFKIRTGLATMLAAGLASSAALGGGPLYLNPGDPDGVERWPNGGLDIPFNPDGVPAGGPGALALGPLDWVNSIAEIQAGFNRWESIATATATYANNGPMPFDVDETNFAPFVSNLFFGGNTADGFSPIVLDQDGAIFTALFGFSGVLGFASVDTRAPDGTPIEAVSFLNGGSILNGYPLADFLGVIFHEFGHYSGLAHTVVNGQSVGLGDTSGPTPFDTYGPSPVDQVETMFPFALIGGGQVTPHADDIGFYSFLYPSADYFDTSGTITGTVLAGNGTTPLTGVNVIARNVADPFEDAVSSISGDRGESGVYTINGLTPGAEYTVHIDQILQGGFSTSPILIPGPEEFYNGASESNNISSPDDPSDATLVASTAGVPTGGVDVIINSFGPGDPLPVGDEGFVELPLPFEFGLCGETYDTVFVNANGTLTFGARAPFPDFITGVNNFLFGPPRVAPWYDDLDQSAGGTVFYEQDKNSFTVNWDAVPEWLFGGANTFSVTLRKASNGIDFEYGDLSPQFFTRLVGVSCGRAVTTGFETADDLSLLQEESEGRIRLLNQAAVYEVWSGAPTDLENSSLHFNGTTDFNDNWAEKNDTPNKARSISVPFDSIDVVRYTEIEPTGGDIDWYRFDAVGGKTLAVEIIAGRLDTLIALFDDEGNLVDADDDGGAGLLSKIQVPLDENGAFYLAVTTFPDFGLTGDGGSGGRYVLDIRQIDGLLLDLGDDDSEEVPLGFSFPFNGANYDSVFVNSNGSLTFGGGDNDFSESVSEFLNERPRIAALWDDLSPNQGGTVSVDFGPGTMTVTFDSVPQFVAGDSNNFAVTLNEDGSFSIVYGNIDASDGLVGVTEGNGAADPGETDLSAAGPLSASGTTYELFSSGDNDLSGVTLEFNP